MSSEDPAPGSARSLLPVQAFQDLDRRDENQILAEIRGELVDEFVYSITLQGRQVTNLSYAGVKEAIRRRGNFEILSVDVSETDTEFRALVRVRDLVNRIDVLGASTAEKSRPFAYVLALNKAERNGYSKLIPAKWYATLIADWLERKKAPSQSQGAVPAGDSGAPPWESRVPLTREPLTQAGLRQFPLTQGTLAVGMLNLLEDGSEASIVPEKPIPADDPALLGFLYSKVLDGLAETHPGFEYHVAEKDGILEAILVRGKLDEATVKELSNASRWSFSKASERMYGDRSPTP